MERESGRISSTLCGLSEDQIIGGSRKRPPYGRQLELVRHDQFSMGEGSEALGAAKRPREEEELHNLLGRGPSSKGGDGGYGGKNRKGKATGKGQPDDGGKNRGGDHRPKDDGRPSGKK